MTDDAPIPRKRRALRWLLIASATATALTLIVGAVIGARSFAWDELPAFIDGLAAWRSSPLAMLTMLGAFVVGGLVVFPINLLIATSIVVFGPIVGSVVALLGSVASATALHRIGRSFPEHVWTRFAGRYAENLRERIARHGVIAVAVVRLLPVAPYSVVSVAAGVAGIGLAPYLAGTAPRYGARHRALRVVHRSRARGDRRPAPAELGDARVCDRAHRCGRMARASARATSRGSAHVTRLRIATYNIHSGVGVDRRFRPQRIVDVIDELAADSSRCRKCCRP